MEALIPAIRRTPEIPFRRAHEPMLVAYASKFDDVFTVGCDIHFVGVNDATLNETKVSHAAKAANGASVNFDLGDYELVAGRSHVSSISGSVEDGEPTMNARSRAFSKLPP